jgi:hypothetical protein
MDMLETMVATLGGEDGIWWLAGAYFGMVILERVFAFFRSDFKYNDKDALCSIGLNLINSVFNIVVGMLLPLIVMALAILTLLTQPVAVWLAAQAAR